MMADAANQAANQPSVASPRQPEQRVGRRVMLLSVTHLVLGLIAVVSGAAALVISRDSTSAIYVAVNAGLVCGTLFIVTGVVGIATTRLRTTCVTVAFMISSILSILFAISFAATSGINTGLLSLTSGLSAESDAGVRSLRGLSIFMLIVALVETIVAVWSSIECCGRVCCGRSGASKEAVVVVYQYQPPASQAVPTFPATPTIPTETPAQVVGSELTYEEPYYASIGPSQGSTDTAADQSPALPPRTQQTIDSMQVLFIELISQGRTGELHTATVHNLRGTRERTLVAVRCAAKKKLTSSVDSHERSGFDQELLTLQRVIPHDNVVSLLAYAEDPTRGPLLITDYMKHGSLKSYLKKLSEVGTTYQNLTMLTQQQAVAFALDIAKGCEHLARLGYLHRDLSTRSVLINAELTCKLSNFGLASDVVEYRKAVKRTGVRIPVRWMAPESLQSNTYTVESDVWSYGVLVWELLTLGATPYPECQTAAEAIAAISNGELMERPPGCVDDVYALMRACWKREPEERFTFQQIRAESEKLLGSFSGYALIENSLARESVANSYLSAEHIEELI
ncbi:PREDICTED: proto-oncogene tyrosine-protein kinase receptor Ret-like [Priapulus caudatus]|uniref:Proto-oncogene tyrosine-protein kinase receptor Ret-like n=1 Tax=Priapulus caudatus TaxID=37621 RepID=A0ABM1E4A2_PRICU|nr:PREDICTED: proto-oncogene tyrosine-protein kinase receptor Ret-like [Priapulus caudatus]